MLAELRGAALLDGVRGTGVIDREAIVELLVRISELATRHMEIREMDLNPIAAYASGLSVLDARILLEHEVKTPRAANAGPGSGGASSSPPGESPSRAQAAQRGCVRRSGLARFPARARAGNFKGNRFSVQPDEKEAAAIEALGISNFRTVSEIGEPIDYAIVSVPRKIVAPDACAMRRGRGRRHRILHRRFFRNRRSHRN